MRPTLNALPRIRPIVPTAQRAPFNHPDWLFEPKYDGLIYLTRESCTIYSERGHLLTRFQDPAEQVRAELPWYKIKNRMYIQAVGRRELFQLRSFSARLRLPYGPR